MSKEDYLQGYRDGWREAMFASNVKGEGMVVKMDDDLFITPPQDTYYTRKKPKRKVKQTKKQKLLTQMTKKKWDKYKKGRGKKTYVEIRAEVSRSQAYKKAAKRL